MATQRVPRADRSGSRRGSLYEELREQIATGALAPGMHLVETVLGEANGVSRTPVREALRRLEQDGLVEHFERGLRVRQQGPQEILDVYEVRIVLEGQVAKTAAERHRDIDRLRMQTMLARMAKIPAGDVEAMADCNRNFHEVLWQASHNRTLVDVLKRLGIHLERFASSTYLDPARWNSAQQQHEELVQAILDRDGDRAEALARHHMSEARDIRMHMWRDDPEFTI